MMWVWPSYFSKFVQFVLSTQVFSVEMLFMLKCGDGFEYFYLKKLNAHLGSVFFNLRTEQFYSSKKKLSLAV
tara:strand:+ start:427 stop:642 length:216 start_codon:yes stop_codon:yes gene_type:complete